jgi:tRNA (guanine-N7-)-methyltransferase
MLPTPYSDAPRLPEGEVLDPRSILGTSGPIELEIGPGRGWFMIDRLQAFPDVFMLGLEVRRKWASIVDARLGQRGLSGRGRVFAEDARVALPRLATGSVRAVFVHFPDPWWKRRHQKRTVLTRAVIEELSRLLQPGGELFLQTDVMDRAVRYAELIGGNAAFAPVGKTARVAENPFGVRSPRERRVLADGLPVARLHFRRL